MPASSPVPVSSATVHTTALTDDRRYIALSTRDRSQDGAWFYALRSTGVFCKPSCGARLPRRENVSFHESIDDAIAAGFRPCKRCRPTRDRDVEAATSHAATRHAATVVVTRSEPTARRSTLAGIGETIRYAISATSLGAILVGTTAKGVCSIQMADDAGSLERALRASFPAATLVAGGPGMSHTVDSVVAFVESPRGTLDVPLDIRGTTFQQRVWTALRQVASGTTTTYADVARAIGAPNAARAVAAACAANPLAIAIPCHRVISSSGALAGYRWGVARKATLLEREAGE